MNYQPQRQSDTAQIVNAIVLCIGSVEKFDLPLCKSAVNHVLCIYASCRSNPRRK